MFSWRNKKNIITFGLKKKKQPTVSRAMVIKIFTENEDEMEEKTVVTSTESPDQSHKVCSLGSRE